MNKEYDVVVDGFGYAFVEMFRDAKPMDVDYDVMDELNLRITRTAKCRLIVVNNRHVLNYEFQNIVRLGIYSYVNKQNCEVHYAGGVYDKYVTKSDILRGVCRGVEIYDYILVNCSDRVSKNNMNRVVEYE